MLGQIAADILRSKTGGIIFDEQLIAGGPRTNRKESVNAMNTGDIV